MKEEIYTIPLTEAYENQEILCPFCFLKEKQEKDLIDYTLGPSMMEPDCREESNAKGFCAHHLKLLSQGGNRLSLALMLSTHFDAVLEDLEKLAKKKPNPTTGLLKKKDSGVALPLLEKHLHDCVICEKMDYTEKRYVEVFLYLWDRESEFREKVKQSRGFCNRHLLQLIQIAPHKLKEESCRDFLSAILKVQAAQARKEKETLAGYIDQFDYQQRSDHPDQYKNGVADVILRLRGKE